MPSSAPDVAQDIAFELTGTVSTGRNASKFADYDGDGTTDFGVIRWGVSAISPTEWFILKNDGTDSNYDYYQYGFRAGTSRAFNGVGLLDVVLPEDYDGDGITDVATIKNSLNNMIWTINRSRDNVIQTVIAGVYLNSYHVQGDYNADGKTDIAVYYKTGTGSATPSAFWVRQDDGSYRVTPWGHGFDNSITSIRAY